MPHASKAMDASVTELHDWMVPMRDGVSLATDIYLPASGEGRFPTLMERTPYNKRGVSRSEYTAAAPESQTRDQVGRWFAARGYAVVIQDSRGRYGSEGVFTKYLNESEDGYDTMLWLQQQPWCNGKVGTMGLSYGGHTQTALAGMAPPGLAAMFIDSGGFSSAYHSGIRQGGAFELKQATWAYRHALLSQKTADDPERKRKLEAVDIIEWFKKFPWAPGNSPLSAAPEYESYLFEQWEKGIFDSSWKLPCLYADGYHHKFPDVPIAIVGSWYDPYVRTCISNFKGLSGRKSPVRLLMGPWTHGRRSTDYSGDVNFGKQAILDGNVAEDYFKLRLDWFDRFLKDDNNDTDDPFPEPVTYFTMGGGSGERGPDGRLIHGGRWQSSDNWPPENSSVVPFYLGGAGSLSTQPCSEVAQFTYRFDPADPVPTVGGNMASGEPLMRPGAYDQRQNEPVYGDHAVGEPLANRGDVLVFETAPLDEDLEVSGTVTAKLWVSSDCPDTDFTVKLLDVYPPGDDYPEGYAMNLTTGILRARYRDSWECEVWMEPGEIYPIEISLFDTSNRFAAGHRMRIEISSSNYPHFDCNPNTGEPEGKAQQRKVATNRIHISETRPSQIRLCIVRKECDVQGV